MIESIGGKIGVISHEGEGSHFWFELPLSISSATKASEEIIEVTTNNLNILLVEDMKINQDVAYGLLTRDGHTVTIASTGNEAVSLCNKHHYDAILMDVHLGGVSGIDVCQQIHKQCDANLLTPVIALTASIHPDDIRKYLKAGMHNVVAKPIDAHKLQLALANSYNKDPDTTISQSSCDESQRINIQLLLSHINALGTHKVNQLCLDYKKLCNELLPNLSEALSHTDFFEATAIAHKLAGGADTLGFLSLSKHLREIEILSDSHNKHEATSSLNLLAKLVDESLDDAYQLLHK